MSLHLSVNLAKDATILLRRSVAGTAVGRARSERAGYSNARPNSRVIALEYRHAGLPRQGSEERRTATATSTVRPTTTTATLFEPPPLCAAPLFTRPSAARSPFPFPLGGRRRQLDGMRRWRRQRSNSTSVCMNTLYSVGPLSLPPSPPRWHARLVSCYRRAHHPLISVAATAAATATVHPFQSV